VKAAGSLASSPCKVIPVETDPGCIGLSWIPARAGMTALFRISSLAKGSRAEHAMQLHSHGFDKCPVCFVRHYMMPEKCIEIAKKKNMDISAYLRSLAESRSTCPLFRSRPQAL
jgi:hypothetical protein